MRIAADRNADAARSAAKVQRALVSVFLRKLDCVLGKNLCVRARDENARPHDERQPHKLPLAEDVLQRLSLSAALRHGFCKCTLRLRHAPLAKGRQAFAGMQGGLCEQPCFKMGGFSYGRCKAFPQASYEFVCRHACPSAPSAASSLAAGCVFCKSVSCVFTSGCSAAIRSCSGGSIAS